MAVPNEKEVESQSRPQRALEMKPSELLKKSECFYRPAKTAERPEKSHRAAQQTQPEKPRRGTTRKQQTDPVGGEI